MAIKSVIDKDETLEKRVTRLEAILRKVLSVVEIHWGIDMNKDGKVGKAHIGLIAFMMIVSVAIAGTTTIWDIGTGVSGGIGTCNVKSDGTNATLTVDKSVIGTQSVVALTATTSITLPAASIASTALPATIANSTVASNANLKVYGSNLVLVANGSITVAGNVPFNGVETNLYGTGTNIYRWYWNGIVTNVSFSGP